MFRSLFQSCPKAARPLAVLVAVTATLSLLYGIQYYAGGPLRLSTAVEIRDLALSPSRALLAAAANDGTVRLWDLENDWTQHTLDGHQSPVIDVAFDPTGATLISVARDGKILLWDVASRQITSQLSSEGEALNAASLTSDGSTLATIDRSGLVNLWDLTTGRLVRSIGPNADSGNAIAVSPDGSLIATDDGNNIQIWDAHTGEAVQSLVGYWEDETKQEDWLGHERPVTALSFSPTGDVLVSGGADTILVFWDLEDGEVIGEGTGHWSAISKLAFDEAGTEVLSGSRDTKVRSWRLPNGKNTGTYVGHLGSVNGVVFGRDPNTLLSGSNDGTVLLQETASAQTLRVEWTQVGLLPLWGQAFAMWALASGLLGLFCLWGLLKGHLWSHLLTLGLFLLGPLLVIGLPTLETWSYPLSWGERLQVAWPLLLLAVWYYGIVLYMMREPVAVCYEAPASGTLSEKLRVRGRTIRVRTGLFTGAVWGLILVALFSVLRRFMLDISFMRHFLSFIMTGAGTTLYVSAAAILLAVILALIGALGRLSKNPIANGAAGFYVSLIRGTPLLVQIYIWYLGLPRVNVVLEAIPAGIMALGVCYGAYMTETFRAGIQAISKGQHEAAQALGMSGAQVFRRVVLPQAFRIVIPPIGNDFIAMMKDSSLVSLMAVWELSYRAEKIGRRYFRSLETFLIAAAFYWLLTIVFSFFQGKLEAYLARSERK